MRTVILLVVLLLAILGGMIGWYFSDQEIAKRKMLTMLEELSNAANANDQTLLFSKIDQYFAPNSKIMLNVQYKVFALGQSGEGRGFAYDHTRDTFKPFLAEKIQRVNGYGMRFTLNELNLSEQDKKQFTAKVDASGFATGVMSMMTQNVNSRFIINGDCTFTGEVGEQISVRLLDCPTTLSQQADMSKVNLKDTLKQLQGVQP